MKTLVNQELADREAVTEHLLTGKPIDSAAYDRIKERARTITDDLRKKHGEMNLSVDLIRGVRDE